MERLEKQFQSSFLRKLRTIPYSVWAKTNDRASVGLADVFGVVRGVPVLLELKRRGERLTPLQYRKLKRYDAAGAVVGAVDEDNAGEWLHDLPNLNGSCTLAPEPFPLRMLPNKNSPATAKRLGNRKEC